MFGSDWPVCTLAAPYTEVLLLVGECSTEEQSAILGDNGARFCRLSE